MHLPLNRQTPLRAKLLQWTPVQACGAMSLLAVLCSVLLTALAMWLAGQWTGEALAIALGIAAVVPALAAPPLFLFVLRLLHQVERQRHLLTELAVRDDLTGLFNRRHFVELADIEVSRSQRHGEPLSLLLLDIDNFKQVNDRHGHAAGDKALRAVARACTQPLRGHDVLARFGGEEFAVLLPATPAQDAQVVAEKLRRSVQDANLRLASGQALDLTVTLGLAQWRPEVLDLNGLLAQADQALYAGKARGKNCWVVA